MSRDDGVCVPSGMRVSIVEENPPPVFGKCPADSYFDDKSLATFMPSGAASVARLRGMRISFIDQDPDLGRRVWSVDEDSDRKSHGERVSLVGEDSDFVSTFEFVDKCTDVGRSIRMTNACFREKKSKERVGACDNKSWVSGVGVYDCDIDNYRVNDNYCDDDDEARIYQNGRKHTCSLLIKILSYYRSKMLRDGGALTPSGRIITFVGEGWNMGMKICFLGEFFGDKSHGEWNQKCVGAHDASLGNSNDDLGKSNQKSIGAYEGKSLVESGYASQGLCHQRKTLGIRDFGDQGN